MKTRLMSAAGADRRHFFDAGYGRGASRRHV